MAGGYPLDTPAKALTSFAHRSGPLWLAFADKVEGEIERIEDAGFEVAPRARRADDGEQARESAIFSGIGLLFLIFLLALWIWGR
ncbi:hypothetical protein [Rhodoblastus sp.]|uniref:hypothetical protein n=1 Tax=Rhodoblastus sp. TaxID=1962975 RepID=UPI003F9D9A4C